MIDRVAGEVIAVPMIVESDGRTRVAAILATSNGPVAGVLVGPSNGTAGPLAFEPVPELAEPLRVQSPEWEIAARAAEEAEEFIGPDPDDPRGLRPKVRKRRAGMKS